MKRLDELPEDSLYRRMLAKLWSDGITRCGGSVSRVAKWYGVELSFARKMVRQLGLDGAVQAARQGAPSQET